MGVKRIVAMALCLCTILSLFAACGTKEEEEAYVPTGDAILMEGEEPT